MTDPDSAGEIRWLLSSPGRYTAQIGVRFVIFLIGMRINRILR